MKKKQARTAAADLARRRDSTEDESQDERRVTERSVSDGLGSGSVRVVRGRSRRSQSFAGVSGSEPKRDVPPHGLEQALQGRPELGGLLFAFGFRVVLRLAQVAHELQRMLVEVVGHERAVLAARVVVRVRVRIDLRESAADLEHVADKLIPALQGQAARGELRLG